MTSVHLLPFNTKFRGITNISEHFKPEPLIIDITATNSNEEVAVKKAVNELPYEKDMYVAAPKSESEKEEEQEEAQNNAEVVFENPEEEKQKAIDGASLFVSHFRGRKLIGRRVNLENNDQHNNSGDKNSCYLGVVALIPLQEEDEIAELNSDVPAGSLKRNTVGGENVDESNSKNNGDDAGASFVPGWKKKTKTQTTAAAAKESGIRRQREEDGAEDDASTSRPTEAHNAGVLVDATTSSSLKEKSLSAQVIVNGRIPSGRAVVPLETFKSFVVWDHDRLATATASPAIGTNVWMGVAEALHGM